MAIKYYERYPQRWESPSQDYPQGAFKNLSALGEQDGSYLEASWLNDQSGFFGALLRNAEMTPNGLVDTAQKSQFYDALLVCARKAVNLGDYYTKAQVDTVIQDNKTKVDQELGDSADKTVSQVTLTKYLDMSLKYSLEFYGVSLDTSPEFNADVFSDLLKKYGKVTLLSLNSYEFNFENIELKVNHKTIRIDLGVQQHIVHNMNIIKANNASEVYINVNLNYDNDKNSGFIECKAVKNLNIPNFKVSNILNTVNSSTQSGDVYLGIHYSSNYYHDENINVLIGNLEAHNVITIDPDDGNEYIASIIGNYGSATERDGVQNISIDNLIFTNLYSQNAQGEVVLGGMNPLRFFSNPVNINISNMILENVGKRVFKTQTYGAILIGNLTYNNDYRFVNHEGNTGNFTAMFSLQNSAKNRPMDVTINNAYIYMHNPCRIPSADYISHKFQILSGNLQNVVCSVSARAVGVEMSIKNCDIDGLEIVGNNASFNLYSCHGNLKRLTSGRSNIVNCDLTIEKSSSDEVLTNLLLINSNLKVKGDGALGSYKMIENSNITLIAGNIQNIPLLHIAEPLTYVKNVKVIGGISTALFFSRLNSSNSLIFRDVDTGSRDLFYSGSGTNNVVVDNCNGRVIGSNFTLKTVVYQ